MKGYTTVQIACIRGQTERNIRKVKATMLKKIRKKVYEYLTSDKQHSMTAWERRFTENYRKKIDNDE